MQILKKIFFIQGEEFIVILLAFPGKTCKCQQIRSKTRDREVGLSPSPNPHPGPDQRQPLSDRCRKCREIRFTTQLFLSQYFRWFNKYNYCLYQVFSCWCHQKKDVELEQVRVAEVVRGHGGPPPKSLDSDENFKLEHTLFCRELRFVAIYALFGDLQAKKVPFWVKNSVSWARSALLHGIYCIFH